MIKSDYSGSLYITDARGYFPLGFRNVLAARLVAGWGTDNPRPFVLGGAGSQGVDSLNQSNRIFNKRYFPLRGYSGGLSELTGRRMGLFSLEWRFPMFTIDHGLTSPPVGMQQIYGKFFMDAGDAWDNDSREEKSIRRGIGSEINAEVIVGYRTLINIRVGAQHGMDARGKNWSFYVATGTSF